MRDPTSCHALLTRVSLTCHPVDAISSAESLGFCTYPVHPASHSSFVLLPIPCLPALFLFLHLLLCCYLVSGPDNSHFTKSVYMLSGMKEDTSVCFLSKWPCL